MERNDVIKKIISFECKDVHGKVRGCGTAFWVKLSGQPTLITAAHIPWPRLPPGGTVLQNSGEKLQVKWKMVGGRSGEGMATFYEHPNNPEIDYASIVFEDLGTAPPEDTFELATTPVAVTNSIISFGFPGSYASASVDTTSGIVERLQVNGPGIFVGGVACGGYSGGPSFRYVSEEIVGDQVIGLMSGTPHPEVTASLELGNAYVLISSKVFEGTRLVDELDTIRETKTEPGCCQKLSSLIAIVCAVVILCFYFLTPSVNLSFSAVNGILGSIFGIVSALLWLDAARHELRKVSNAAAAGLSGAAVLFGSQASNGSTQLSYFHWSIFYIGIIIALLSSISVIVPMSRNIILNIRDR